MQPPNQPRFLAPYAQLLDADERGALEAACVVIVDEISDAIERYGSWPRKATFADRVALFEETMLPAYLPERFVENYTPGFVRRFLVALIAVGTKMAAGEPIRLASVAEQIALRAIVNSAEMLIENRDGKTYAGHGLKAFESEVQEDEDFEFLFSRRYDGIEKSPVVEYLGMVNLEFDKWFDPLAPSDVLHPYIVTTLPFDEEQGDTEA